MTHALTDNRIPPENVADGLPPARVYVMPGRYAIDQWTELAQCDSDGDNQLDDGCAEHVVPCETDDNPATVEYRETCRCDAQLACVDTRCNLPAGERERLPIAMLDTVQLVGYGNPDHVVIDGGLRACVTGEVAGDRCDNDRLGDVNQRGRLLHISDMMDQRREDNAFHDGQPNWYGIGSRNLFANFTLLRDARHFFASQAHGVLEAFDADILFEQMQVQGCASRGARHLILTGRTRLTMAANHFQGNDGASSPMPLGGPSSRSTTAGSTFATAPSPTIQAVGSGLMTWHGAWWCTRVLPETPIIVSRQPVPPTDQ